MSTSSEKHELDALGKPWPKPVFLPVGKEVLEEIDLPMLETDFKDYIFKNTGDGNIKKKN